jgi:hypothetical protein
MGKIHILTAPLKIRNGQRTVFNGNLRRVATMTENEQRRYARGKLTLVCLILLSSRKRYQRTCGAEGRWRLKPWTTPLLLSLDMHSATRVLGLSKLPHRVGTRSFFLTLFQIRNSETPIKKRERVEIAQISLRRGPTPLLFRKLRNGVFCLSRPKVYPKIMQIERRYFALELDEEETGLPTGRKSRIRTAPIR